MVQHRNPKKSEAILSNHSIGQNMCMSQDFITHTKKETSDTGNTGGPVIQTK